MKGCSIPIMTGIPPIKQKLSKNPTSSVTSYPTRQNKIRPETRIVHTILTICNNFIITSLEHLPSRTSKIASIPWEDTSWSCISGASCMIFNNESQASRSWKSGAEGVSWSMSWLTVEQSLACLSRCRLDSRSSSSKPSSIWKVRQDDRMSWREEKSYLREWVFLVIIALSLRYPRSDGPQRMEESVRTH
jgi:hypothetical protein